MLDAVITPQRGLSLSRSHALRGKADHSLTVGTELSGHSVMHSHGFRGNEVVFYAIVCWPGSALLPLPAKTVGAFAGSGERGAVSVRSFVAGIFVIFCLLLSGQGMAATPPGTVIRSQAEASFTDEFNEQFLVTSNEVSTLIQEVTGVRLESPQKFWGMEYTSVAFPHLLTNSGNIRSGYFLEVDDSELSSPYSLHIDSNNNGQADEKALDESKPIVLEPGENISLLLKTYVGKKHSVANIDISARVNSTECALATENGLQGRCRAVNRDIMSSSAGVVYEVSHSADKKVAYIGDQVQTTLSFVRKDERSYKSYVAMDYLLPEELEYVADSSQLCNYGGTSCRDIKDEDAGEGERLEFIENGLRYYLKEYYDQVGRPPSRHEGQIRFKTRVRGGVSETLYNAAEYTFHEIGVPIQNGVRQTTNYVPLEIKGYGVSLNASALSSDPHIGEPQIVASAPAGSIVEFTNYLWNLGTEDTGYEVTLETEDNTFPKGSLYCLTKEEDCTGTFTAQPPELTFAEGDISPGDNKPIRLFVQLPSATDFTPQQNYSLVLKAKDTSTEHSYKVTDTTRNMLMRILGSSSSDMDLTLDAPVDNGGSGVGKGPEKNPLETRSGNPGTTLEFDNIYINNTGDQADNYQLSLVADSGGALVSAFKWFFVNEQDQPIANTVTVPAGESTRVKLRIKLPAGYPPRTLSFFVHAYSTVTKVEDLLHLALEVLGEQQLTLAPDRQAQVTPGSFVTFAHQLTNPGNQEINDIKLTLTHSKESQGWQGMIYEDSDGDGQINGDDAIISAPFALPAGETRWLIVKLFAPANAPQGESNITTLTATWGDSQSLTVTDTALVNSTNVVITKLQAFWNCSGTPPSVFSREPFDVSPGECVVYKLTASNHGVEPAHNVIIHDRAPAFTQFHETDGLPYTETDGNTETDRHKTSGSTINATWTELTPGASVSLIYGIQIQ